MGWRKRHSERLIELGAVTQTTFGFPMGNCFEACIATLLRVPIDAVPDPRRGKSNREAARVIKTRLPAINRWLMDTYTLTMVRDQGPHPPVVGLRDDDPPLFWIAAGRSNRGLMHAVIYGNEEIAWDPHPSRDGILRVKGWTLLAPIGPLYDRVT